MHSRFRKPPIRAEPMGGIDKPTARNERVVSETQCIKDEIFAYMAESARRDCGVPESATVFW